MSRGPGARISALPPGRPPETGTGAEVIDWRVYRTELIRDKLTGGWLLSVDAVEVAATDTPLPPPAAAGWACRQMGEGVVFLNGVVGEPADSGYWVANPESRSEGGHPWYAGGRP